jgi:selenocysteine-specific elongation factor
MPVVGTAGHVDHGKSTLIEALTGRDPDRWDEEKQRGLTIDLGFAWTTLDDGTEVGFIDVPGHERFIKNMLAGIDAIDVALFVVAADEGWMPQSEEHLAVIDLLGIGRGVIALTRIDITDADTADLAELEIQEKVSGTVLENAPIVRTGATAGIGTEEVRTALKDALAAAPVRTGDRTRMWIDRSFTIGGAGTVVTGTLLDGPVGVGDQLTVWPEADRARVRSIQSHEQARDHLDPGNRAALNLAGVTRDTVPRGAMLGRPEDWQPTKRFLANLRTVRNLASPLRDRGAFQLHVGSGAFPARLRLVEAATLDRSGVAVIEPDRDIPLKVGDRFILREVGRRAVVAGGVVIDPDPHRRKAQIRAVMPILLGAGEDPGSAAQALLDVRGQASLRSLSAHSGGGRPASAVVAGDTALSVEETRSLAGAAIGHVADFHQTSPLREGMPAASLAERLGLDLGALEVLVDGIAELVRESTTIRSAGFQAGLDDDAGDAWETARVSLEAAGMAAPRRSELGLDPEVLHALMRRKELVEVSADFVYLPKQVDELVERVTTFDDEFTVGTFRDALGITRKHAVPLLEWLDRSGVTRRVGDVRVVRRPQSGERGTGDVPSR